MKRFILTLFLLIFNNFVLANENIYNAVYHNAQVFYSPISETWSFSQTDDSDIELQKTLVEGDGGYSIYNKADKSIAFALATNYELIHNQKLIIIDNNLLKYYKLNYFDGSTELIELTDNELKNLFPEYEIFKLSQIDSDNKIWIYKPFRKTRKLLLVNDTDKFFHRISCKAQGVQDSEIKGLVTIPRYGIIKFTHYGEYNGKLIFYVR